ncbi:shikimate kinase [uncultured Jannaschia sp.]|uniref:shikimate kinase n=1 Tax=uncultured Jannaschia sp. TaxID=293347 RepID=UPI0026227AC6|nr:shikimate kinase [uncultured Jannaschia sp.]
MGNRVPGIVTAERGLRLMRPVVLVGMMGSGKTAVGTALAMRLRVPFRDTDEEMVAAARMTIPEIFERDGEAFFRRRETEVLRRVLAAGPGILSTGGGAFLRPENREAIRRLGVSVWLRADGELLWSRVRHKTTRPLLMTADPKATLLELLESRTPAYAEADLAVESDPDVSIAGMTGRVVDTLKQAGVLA